MSNTQLVLSLMPGIDLLGLAFQEEGYCVVRGGDPIFGGDVRKEHYPAGKFEGIICGPPCQMFSPLSRLVRAAGRQPRFGNLIPEFTRCVDEARPAWFLMENVPQAPEPAPAGYGVKAFLLDNSALDGGDGFGLEQRRTRRFSFGLLGVVEPPSLLRWIDLATFFLPDASGSDRLAVTAGGLGPNSRDARCRRVQTVTSAPVDNSAEARRRVRRSPVIAGHEQPDGLTAREKRMAAVTSSDGGPSVRMGRYKLADALRLQGLPEDFLDNAPFTAEGKLKAVANGVPIPMGRVIARAIKEAIQT